MRRLPLFALILLFAANPLAAQAAHQNILTWTASTSTGVVGYNVYKSAGPCSPTAVFTKVGSLQVALTFTDTGMADGAVNCYYITAVNSAGLESITSGTQECKTPIFTADAHPLPPGKPSALVQ